MAVCEHVENAGVHSGTKEDAMNNLHDISII